MMLEVQKECNKYIIINNYKTKTEKKLALKSEMNNI